MRALAAGLALGLLLTNAPCVCQPLPEHPRCRDEGSAPVVASSCCCGLQVAAKAAPLPAALPNPGAPQAAAPSLNRILHSPSAAVLAPHVLLPEPVLRI